MADFSRDNITYSSPYADVAGYQDTFNKYVNQLGGVHSDSGAARAQILKELNGSIDQFKNLFQNNVGREANPDEVAKYLQESGSDSLTGGVRDEALRNKTAQYIGDTFQKTAQDVAQQKTQDLASQYGSLADQYMAMGQKSLGNLSDELKTYSTSLFDKLRPQLNLAAQAGGYADSGGQTLQEQGALKDLATQGQGVLIPAAQEIEQNANNIRYGGIAAPVSMSAQFAADQPYALANTSAGALNFNNANYIDTQNYLRQLGLMSAQNKLIQERNPSFGYTLTQGLATNPFAGSGTGGNNSGLVNFGGQGLGTAYKNWSAAGAGGGGATGGGGGGIAAAGALT